MCDVPVGYIRDELEVARKPGRGVSEGISIGKSPLYKAATGEAVSQSEGNDLTQSLVLPSNWDARLAEEMMYVTKKGCINECPRSQQLSE